MQELLHRTDMTQQIFTDLYCGRIDKMLPFFHKDITWIASGEEAYLQGFEQVSAYLRLLDLNEVSIIKQSYKIAGEGKDYCIVTGRLELSDAASGIREHACIYTQRISVVWIQDGKEWRFIHANISRNADVAKTIYQVEDRNKHVHYLTDRDILYVEARDNYTSIHTWEKEIEIRATMHSFSQRLSPSFLKIHRSYIVNVSYIAEVCKNAIFMKNKEELPIPAKRYREIREQILAYF